MNILTIEEPIEYQLANIGQIQVKPKIGLTFALGLRHILRQDPDVVLVGETRDLETAEIAIRASLTGHLVFTTLHTNDAISSIIRLVDMGVEPFLISSCLEGVLAQRLIRRLCPVCRKKESIDAQTAQRFGRFGSQLEGKEAWAAVGCDECLEGYSGRQGLFELFTVTDGFKELMRRREIDSSSLKEMAVEQGMVTLLEDGVDKILNGVTSVAEVLDVAG
jgi:general secretion pathway protein E